MAHLGDKPSSRSWYTTVYHGRLYFVQIRKARGVWGRLSRVMRAENASPRVCGMFYKATVQAVLLFGSETWCLSPANLRLLEGFHVHAARRMTGMMPKRKSDRF